MPSARRVSPRRIVVPRLDNRCLRGYRRSADRVAATAADDEASGDVPTTWRLECRGRIREDVAFDYAQLVAMATLDDRLGFGIALTDLLAEIGLQTGAEVLLARDSSGRTFGVPIRDVVATDTARLTLGTRRAPLGADDGFPIRLDVPGWTDRSDPIVVESLEAVGFAEFVRCP